MARQTLRQQLEQEREKTEILRKALWPAMAKDLDKEIREIIYRHHLTLRKMEMSKIDEYGEELSYYVDTYTGKIDMLIDVTIDVGSGEKRVTFWCVLFGGRFHVESMFVDAWGFFKHFGEGNLVNLITAA